MVLPMMRRTATINTKHSVSIVCASRIPTPAIAAADQAPTTAMQITMVTKRAAELANSFLSALVERTRAMRNKMTAYIMHITLIASGDTQSMKPARHAMRSFSVICNSLVLPLMLSTKRMSSPSLMPSLLPSPSTTSLQSSTPFSLSRCSIDHAPSSVAAHQKNIAIAVMELARNVKLSSWSAFLCGAWLSTVRRSPSATSGSPSR